MKLSKLRVEKLSLAYTMNGACMYMKIVTNNSVCYFWNFSVTYKLIMAFLLNQHKGTTKLVRKGNEDC